MARRVITTSTRYLSDAKCKQFVAWDFVSADLIPKARPASLREALRARMTGLSLGF